MKNFAIVLAAGSSARFGSDKLSASLGERQVWQAALETFLDHPAVEGVGLVASQGIIEQAQSRYPSLAFAVQGGTTRTESAYAGLQSIPAGFDNVLVHDAARPFVSPELIQRVCDALRANECVLPAVPVTDTVRVREGSGEGMTLLPRDRLLAAQTPQAGRLSLLMRAHQHAIESGHDSTDDVGLMERVGVQPFVVEGDLSNYKVTHPHDLPAALQEGEQRRGAMHSVTGFGYDTHRFSDDPDRPCWLGCVELPGELALDGHSDADVIAHAIVDAVLGAVGGGDIGQLFPNDAPENKDRRSADFLQAAAECVRDSGATLLHVDATYLGEKPKISRFTQQMREAVATALGILPTQVSIKATTNERMGAIGAGEGAAAFAVATIGRVSL